MALASQSLEPRLRGRVVNAAGLSVDPDTYYPNNDAPAYLDLEGVTIPSFHRPALANFWFHRLYNSDWLSGIPAADRVRAILSPYDQSGAPRTGLDFTSSAQVAAIKRKFMMRPLREDHPDFDGSNPLSRYGTAAIEAALQGNNLVNDNGEITFPYWEAVGPWDVDNDGDGVPDSVWVDVGLPVQQTEDGRWYKPLVAMLVEDLDGRLNLNVHGSADDVVNNAEPVDPSSPDFDALLDFNSLDVVGQIGAGTIRIDRPDSPLGYFLPIDAAGIDLTSLRFSYDKDGQPIDSETSPAGGDTTTMFATTPAPYKIYRVPTSAGGEPLELPAGVAVDLQASAFGTVGSVQGEGRLYSPHVDYEEAENAFTIVREDDVMVLFAPEGHIHRVHGVVTTNPQPSQSQSFLGPAPEGPTAVTSYLALCVGRRELIPALRPEGQTTATRDDYASPINLEDDLNGLSETETRELTGNYNWLNLESRWVIIGGQSGAITTVENSQVYASPGTRSIDQQIAAALESAPRRTAIGGR